MGTQVEHTVCMFCNEPILGEQEACALTITAAWTQGSGTYWGHGACLQAATHPQIPLYILSLHRDARVFGSKQTETEDLSG